MPGAVLARIRDGDPDVWRSATRAAPVVVQFVIATALGFAWLLSSAINGPSAYRIVATAAIIVPTAAALVIGAVLLRAESPRRHGVGLAVCGSAVVIFISGLAYALIFLPWLESGA